MAGWIHKIGAVTYRVTDDPDHRPHPMKVERWQLVDRKSGKMHWVEVNSHFAAYTEVITIFERHKREKSGGAG